MDATAASLSGGTGDAELAALGSAVSAAAGARAVLAEAASAIDADPDDRLGGARRRALEARHAVHAAAVVILAATAAAGGARPLCLDAVNAGRAADLHAYLAQHHPGRDGVALGRLAADAAERRR